MAKRPERIREWREVVYDAFDESVTGGRPSVFAKRLMDLDAPNRRVVSGGGYNWRTVRVEEYYEEPIEDYEARVEAWKAKEIDRLEKAAQRAKAKAESIRDRE